MKLFQVKKDYGRGKRVGEYFANKMEAKAFRNELNGKDAEEPYFHQIRVGPDHWRY